ncbi:MAG: hypothetical protein IPK03_13190 [Bacteroidetes bacterium]|nr:hypothetical protein [Bacteroidota bacterium]
MERTIRIFVVLTFFLQRVLSQNLILNPDFDTLVEISCSKSDPYSRQFLAKHWQVPTVSSVDYLSLKEENKLKSYTCKWSDWHPIQVGMKNKIGDNCIGIYPMGFGGYIENISGKLNEPLKKDSIYIVSLKILNAGTHNVYSSLIPRNFGYKFSCDSQVFKIPDREETNTYVIRTNKSKGNHIYNIPKTTRTIKVDPKEKNEGQASCFYQYLFEDNDVYADGIFDLSLIDSTWHSVESVYKARGDEKYLTLSVYKFSNHKEIMELLNKLHFKVRGDKAQTKYFKKHLNKLNLLCFPKNGVFSEENINLVGKYRTFTYLLIDNVSVEQIKH